MSLDDNLLYQAASDGHHVGEPFNMRALSDESVHGGSLGHGIGSPSPPVSTSASPDAALADNDDEASVVGRALTAIVDIGSSGVRFSISSKAAHHARIMPCVFKDRLGIRMFSEGEGRNEGGERNMQGGNIQGENMQGENMHAGRARVNGGTARAPAGSADEPGAASIPPAAIHEIIQAMRRFRWICEDFGVPANGVRVVASEATREAPNAAEFQQAIHQATGWKVRVLSREEEGRTAAYGVASCFHDISGLFLDMGASSAQLSWIRAQDGAVRICDHPVTMPYGAAALSRRMRTESVVEIYGEIKRNFSAALERIQLPGFLIDEARANGGFRLFVCGGGLRGFGRLLLACQPGYPIQTVINGYSTASENVERLANYLLLERRVPRGVGRRCDAEGYRQPPLDATAPGGAGGASAGGNSFAGPFAGAAAAATAQLSAGGQPPAGAQPSASAAADPSAAASSAAAVGSAAFPPPTFPPQQPAPYSAIFRVSARRERQMPAVGLLVSAAMESLPRIKTVHFSEGGVREGVLYSMIPEEIKLEDPLLTATRPYAPLLADKYWELLRTGLPTTPGVVPDEVALRIAPALCNVAFVHCSYPKELQPTAALHMATTGIIAGSHGLSHKIRALIGMACCERWGADIPPDEADFYGRLEGLVAQADPEHAQSLIYWTKYCGKMMHVICGIHPGGNIRPGSLVFKLEAEPDDGRAGAGKPGEAGKAAAGGDSDRRHRHSDARYALSVILPGDDIKYSYSVRSRILNLQRKIKRLNRRYRCDGKVKVYVRYGRRGSK